ncbi:MAG: hypothetical protein QF903_11300 [Planctomycetota bacterium]|nr:hypothetical protein [Planctomycetota bacterium]MDP6763254.1 hypothetical protein [Planctomycetota bacterium]MDP6990052.1 hypothetical protein [Planctomycetota bacterium]
MLHQQIQDQAAAISRAVKAHADGLFTSGQYDVVGEGEPHPAREAPPGAERPSKTAGCEVWCACS